MSEQEVKYGEVIWFSKGIGFIDVEGEEKDMFVHFSNIVAEPGEFKTLKQGQKVSFTVGANKNGPQAENVTVLE